MHIMEYYVKKKRFARFLKYRTVKLCSNNIGESSFNHDAVNSIFLQKLYYNNFNVLEINILITLLLLC